MIAKLIVRFFFNCMSSEIMLNNQNRRLVHIPAQSGHPFLRKYTTFLVIAGMRNILKKELKGIDWQ